MREEIRKKVREIVDTKFQVENVTYVPNIDDKKLTFGNKGLQFDATVLFIDLRGSTKLLNKHNKSTVAKIHMAYYHTIIKIAKSLSGEIRSFNGDSLLVFFEGTTKQSLSRAVKAAMQMKYMLSNQDGIRKLVEKYTTIDFGIGIHDDTIMCTKVGVVGDSNTKDLFWISNAVNKSTRLSDKAKSPNNIYISSFVYTNLTDEVKFTTKKNWQGVDEKINMWTKSWFEYDGKQEYCYYTSYHWTVL